MKIQDSGMPEQAYWTSLFDIDEILKWMGCSGRHETVVEIGCGYGTFTIPVATAIKGQLISYDIEQNMLDIVRAEAKKRDIASVALHLCDVVTEGTGLAENSVDRVMLFNILHSAERSHLLMEASRILKPGGQVDILHWRKDIQTPRGPQPDTRPDTRMIQQAIQAGSLVQKGPARLLLPYHWGLQLIKPVAQ